MDNEQNKTTVPTSEAKFDSQPNIWDFCFIAVPIILTIFFPFGVFFYVCGRINFTLAFMMFLLPAILLLMLSLFSLNIIRFFMKHTWKKRILIFIEICLSILFFLSFYFLRIIWDSKDPFLCGYMDRIKSKIDVEEIQNWLKTTTIENKDWAYLVNLPEDQYPKSLQKIFRPAHNLLRTDQYDNQIFTLTEGGGFFHWGFVIGLPDMEYSEEHIKEMEEHDMIWMLVQPGFYVFSQY